MKKIAIISTLILTTAVVFISCDSKRQPGKVYMPDMAYSRAYETYALRDSAKFSLYAEDAGHKIYYNGQPGWHAIAYSRHAQTHLQKNPPARLIHIFQTRPQR